MDFAQKYTIKRHMVQKKRRKIPFSVLTLLSHPPLPEPQQLTAAVGRIYAQRARHCAAGSRMAPATDPDCHTASLPTIQTEADTWPHPTPEATRRSGRFRSETSLLSFSFILWPVFRINMKKGYLGEEKIDHYKNNAYLCSPKPPRPILSLREKVISSGMRDE